MDCLAVIFWICESSGMGGIQLGDLGTWVVGIATAAGLAFTALTLRLQAAQLERVEDDRRRSQASLIAAWTRPIPESRPHTSNEVMIVYRNTSEAPAYDGVITIDTSSVPGAQKSPVKLDIGVFPPKHIDDRIVDIGVPVGDGLLPVGISFKDANGRKWLRAATGELSERPPLISGTRRVFGPRRREPLP
jgi:hypothetical protein